MSSMTEGRHWWAGFNAMEKVIACPHCGRKGKARFMGKHIQCCDPAELARRFWSKVDRRGKNECWGWKAQKRWDGYGRFVLQRRPRWAHRVSWELHNGPIPAGMHVLHSCDNPECTNPKHLRIGTHLENMRDMRAKGRGPDQRRTA